MCSERNELATIIDKAHRVGAWGCVRRAGRRSEAARGAASDSAGLRDTMAVLHRSGRFRFPYGANVYVARINDYYWWENHRPLPTWYAFWEVNTSLIGPTTDSAR